MIDEVMESKAKNEAIKKCLKMFKDEYDIKANIHSEGDKYSFSINDSGMLINIEDGLIQGMGNCLFSHLVKTCSTIIKEHLESEKENIVESIEIVKKNIDKVETGRSTEFDLDELNEDLENYEYSLEIVNFRIENIKAVETNK